MTTRSADCDQVRLAIMATLDGEPPPLSQDSIASHVERCSTCRGVAAELRAMQPQLAAVHYDGPRIDLWPNVAEQLSESADRRREWMAIAVIAAVCVAWRAGQLVFELPLPVWNAAIPLITVALITVWLVGDPLAIKMTTPELRQERA
jgi:predicted anti-sigma-YlaC factor YlaD